MAPAMASVFMDFDITCLPSGLHGMSRHRRIGSVQVLRQFDVRLIWPRKTIHEHVRHGCVKTCERPAWGRPLKTMDFFWVVCPGVMVWDAVLPHHACDCYRRSGGVASRFNASVTSARG